MVDDPRDPREALGLTYTCRAVLTYGPHVGHECGQRVTWVPPNPLYDKGYWIHMDRQLDADHEAQRHDPLRGDEQPRGHWLDSQAHRRQLALGVVSGVSSCVLVYLIGWWAPVSVLAICAFFFVLGMVESWVKRAPRP